jgi:hypothetical protein
MTGMQAADEDLLFHFSTGSAAGSPNVLISETELVTMPWRARPLALFSKDRTSAG